MGNGYLIKCCSCKQNTWASNIVELINDHTIKNGAIKCVACGSLKSTIYKESHLQEKGTWERYIKGVIPIRTEFETYTPYVFLTAQTETGKIDGFHFNYYKDTRRDGGTLKHGHGPGGAPVFSKDELLQLLEKLALYGCLCKKDFLKLINKI